MHFNVYDVFYSQLFHQHVSAGIATIFRVILSEEYKGTKVPQRQRPNFMPIQISGQSYTAIFCS